MHRKDFGEIKEVKGIDYSFEFKGKRISVKFPWENHKRLYVPMQRHTSRIIFLTTFPYPPSIGDAVITDLKGVEIGVKTADCVPLVMVGKRYIGVAHVGWRGLRAGLVEKFTEEFLKREKVNNIFAFIGPCAKGCCYEVGEEFNEYFPEFVIKRDGRLFMDLEESVIKILKIQGIKYIGHLGLCTICSPFLPSYRREKTEERILTSVIIRE